jgi:hypothetical protein
MSLRDYMRYLGAIDKTGGYHGKHPSYWDGDPNQPMQPDLKIADTIVQTVITEREVGAHLEKGFIFKAQLQNGTVIVEKTIPAAKIKALADENIRNFANTQIEAATAQLTKQALTKIGAAASSVDPIPPAPAQRTT